MSAPLAEALATHVAALRYETLPSAAVAAAKKILLDTLAVAWAGTGARGAAAALAVSREQGGAEESTVWGAGGKLPAASAAFTNAVFAAALDFDSHFLGVHADGVVLPAALAVAERQAAGGREFLTALVAANDIACRLGKSAQGAHRGWYYTTIFGIVGAAAASARLLGLDAGATRHALGIALAQASGTQQPAVEHTLAMRFQAGFAARSGVLGALLAAKGVTAPAQALDGKFGLFSLYQPVDPAPVVAGLGRVFHNEQMALKAYPCCACSHAAIQAARELVAKHGLTADTIARVEVRISAEMDRLVGERTIPGADPEVAAQFSVRYAVACALSSGTFSVRHLRPEALADGALRAFAERITVTVDPALTGKFAPAEVEVTPVHGPAVHRRIHTMPGTPEAPVDDAARRAKLAECFGAGTGPLDADRQGLLENRILKLETLTAMSRLFDGIAAARCG